MSKIEKEFICIPVVGWETNHLEIIDPQTGARLQPEAAASLFQEAGAEICREEKAEKVLNYWSADFTNEDLSQKPKLYRTKISIECVEVSKQETEIIWKKINVILKKEKEEMQEIENSWKEEIEIVKETNG